MKKISIIWALCFLFGTFYSQINYIGQLNSPSYKVYLVKLAQNGFEWAKTYVINGKGVPNMFLNEENLTVKYFPNELFPINNIPHSYYIEPKPFPIKIGRAHV